MLEGVLGGEEVGLEGVEVGDGVVGDVDGLNVGQDVQLDGGELQELAVGFVIGLGRCPLPSSHLNYIPLELN